MNINQIDVNGTTYDIKPAHGDTIHYVSSASGTVGKKNSNRSYWTGTVDGVTALYTGLTIVIKTPTAGVNVGIGLNINSLGEHPVVMNVNSLMTTHFAQGSMVMLIYDADQTASLTVSGTSTSYTGCWKMAEYNSDTTTTTRASNKVSTKMYLVGAESQASSVTTYSNVNCYIDTDNCLYSGGSKVLTSHKELSATFTPDVTGGTVGTLAISLV